MPHDFIQAKPGDGVKHCSRCGVPEGDGEELWLNGYCAPTIPEHNKLKAISDKSQAIGDFIEWTRASLCVPHHHEDHCRSDDTGRLMCGMSEGEYEELRTPIRKLLADYFGIDEQRLEDEKRAMLEELRSSHA